MLLYVWHICGPWEGHHGILDKSIKWELENIAKFKVFSINQNACWSICGICGPWEGHHGILDESVVWGLKNVGKYKVLNSNPTRVAVCMVCLVLGKDTIEYWIKRLCGN